MLAQLTSEGGDRIVLATMVVNKCIDAYYRMAMDYNYGGAPHVTMDGGDQNHHGVPGDVTEYSHLTELCCDREVLPILLDVSFTHTADSTITIVVSADINQPSTNCCLLRGDVNHDGIGPDIADLVSMTTYMFQPPSPEPVCEMPEGSGYFPEADINGDEVGPDIADLVYLVSYMFQPPSPAPEPCPG